MRDLGLDAFRFSFAWPRILPEGRGRVNHEGLDFYDRLLDELLESGIRPFATLYHWDLPQVLEDRGGWPSRDTVDAFGEYTEILAGRFGDRIDHWITLNEPRVSSWLGYWRGIHAPGRTDKAAALATSHHLLLAHGRAVEILRRVAPAAKVGITLDLHPVYPATDSELDQAAAKRVDGFENRWFLDPIFRGEYPADIVATLGDDAPPILDGDLASISAPIDFLGVNNYSREVVSAGPDGNGRGAARDPDSSYTDMGWEVYPDGLHDVLIRLRDEYSVPSIYITENGAAFADVRSHDGAVRDPEREAFLEAYIGAVGRAVSEGVPVHGYFVWSLLDNFEWGWGYGKRFGIVYVDYPTQERIPKGSFEWYRDLIAAQRNGTALRKASGM